MSRFVALLRGINVGRAKRVPMADLRDILATLGYTEVQTLLNSGNAIFASAARSPLIHAAQIREAVRKRLNIDVPVIVKTATELVAACDENNLLDIATDPSRLLVAVTQDHESLKLLKTLAPLAVPPERFHLGAHAAFLWCPDGILESKAANALVGKFKTEVTTRNWATMMKIVAALR